LARVDQKEVRDPLTDEILFGKLENGGTVRIRLADDALAFDITPSPPPPQQAPPAAKAPVA
jgi:ATP-dependent Clp protease ATP-binding subunit ClpA